MKWIWKKPRIVGPAGGRGRVDKKVKSQTNRKMHEKLMQHERYSLVLELILDFKDFVMSEDLYLFQRMKQKQLQ